MATLEPGSKISISCCITNVIKLQFYQFLVFIGVNENCKGFYLLNRPLSNLVKNESNDNIPIGRWFVVMKKGIKSIAKR